MCNPMQMHKKAFRFFVMVSFKGIPSTVYAKYILGGVGVFRLRVGAIYIIGQEGNRVVVNITPSQVPSLGGGALLTKHITKLFVN